MGDDPLVSSMVDTLSSMLCDFDALDPDGQARMLFQSLTFFTEIFSTLKSNPSDKLQKTATLFLRLCTRNVNNIVQEPDYVPPFCSFVKSFCESCLVDSCAEALSQLVAGMVNLRGVGAKIWKDFKIAFRAFFAKAELRKAFIKHDGVLSAWWTYVSEPGNSSVHVVFAKVGRNMKDFANPDFLTQTSDLIAGISTSFPKLTMAQAKIAVSFLQGIVSQKPDVLVATFSEGLGFQLMSDFVLAHQDEDPNFVSCLEYFTTALPFQKGRSIPAFTVLIEMLGSDQCKFPLKRRTLTGMGRLFSKMTAKNCPIQPDQLISLISTVTDEDGESVERLVAVLLQLHTSANFDMSSIIPGLFRFFTRELLFEADLSTLISLLLCYPQIVKPNIPGLVVNVLGDIDTDSFAKLITKYDQLPNFFVQHFSDFVDQKELGKLVKLFVLSHAKLENQEAADAAIAKLIREKGGYMYTSEIFEGLIETQEASLLVLLTTLAEGCGPFRQACLFHRVYVYVLSLKRLGDGVDVLLDFVSVLTKHRFNRDLDAGVYETLSSLNFLDATPDQLLTFALGLRQGVDLKFGTLCFPSLLGHCSDYVFTSRYDLWLCGRIGIEAWQRDTGKPISEFPSICPVARQYMEIKHVKELIQYPKIFFAVCSQLLPLPPLFEFVPYYNSSFSLHFYSVRAISFWFNIKTIGDGITHFVTLGETSLLFYGHEIRMDNSVLATVETDAWMLFYAAESSGQWQIYLDKSLIYSFKQQEPVESVKFGGKLAEAYWFIGGTIRLFSAPLGETKLSLLYGKGVGYKTRLFDDLEVERYSASTYVAPHGFDVMQTSVLKKMRPVIIYSLGDYIRNVMTNCQFIFNHALEKSLQGEFEDGCFLLRSLCILRQKGICRWENTTLALAVSALSHIVPQVIGDDSEWLTNIFIDPVADTLDWKAFLVFMLEYTRFLEPNPAKILGSLFGILAQYPIPESDEGSQMALAWFLFSLLAIEDFNHEYDSSVLDMIMKLNLSPSVLLYWTASLPDLCLDLANVVCKYIVKPNPVISVLIKNFGPLQPKSFNEYYLLFSLPPDDAIVLISDLLDQNVPNLDYNIILECLALNCHIRKAWDCALSIMTNSKVVLTDDPSFDLSQFNMTYLVPLLKMLAILVAVAVRLPEDKFWFALARVLCCHFVLLVPSIPEKSMTECVKFWVLQLMSFGNPSTHLSLFPLYPGAKTPEEIVDISCSMGQEWPHSQGSTWAFPRREALDLTETITEVTKNFEDLIPREVYVSSLWKVAVNSRRFHEKVPELCEANIQNLGMNWNSFIADRIGAFGVAHEPVSLDMIRDKGTTLGVWALLGSLAMQNSFLENAIVNCHAAMPADLVVLEQRMIEQIVIGELDLYGKYSANMVELMCRRILQGWSKEGIVSLRTILSIVSKTNENLPQSLLQLFISGFDIIPRVLHPALFDLMVQFPIIATPRFFLVMDIVLPFIAKMFSLAQDFTDGFYLVWKKLVTALQSSEQFLTNLKREWKIEPGILFEAMSVLAGEKADGFEVWQKVKGAEYQQFDQVMRQYLEKNKASFKQNMVTTIGPIMEYRRKMSKDFASLANRILTETEQRFTSSVATAASMRMLVRSSFIIIQEYFIRRREFYLARVFKVPLPDKGRKALTILSDPIYPSRRLEYSPLRYEVPEFPNGTDVDMFPPRSVPYFDVGVYPTCCSNLFRFCAMRAKMLLYHSPYLLHLRYAPTLPIDPWQRLLLLQLLLNSGQPFKLQSQCSFLYGIDTLSGCVFLSEHHLWFFEGVIITQRGVEYFHRHDFGPEQFYQCYMLSGHFGSFSQFNGHMILGWDLSELICVTMHVWIHQPYSICLNFLRGFNFILNFEKENFERLFPILKKFAQDAVDTAPPATNVPSPWNSARYLTMAPRDVTNKWVAGEIDTFTYLCILNRLGRRTVADLTQYPVFPWIVADYQKPSMKGFTESSLRDLSKPMGQIGEERAKQFDEVFRDTEGEYYYGTHYMHFYVVLYFMFRVDPFCFLSILVHKKWDHPNRLFWSLEKSWQSAAYESTADVKEVIPQFFCVPEIFENMLAFPLGKNDDGVDINNVALPNWCKNARDFTFQLMVLFNSKRVAKSIGKWIDLIFGCKSRGDGAREAKNQFRRLCYANVKDHKATEEDDVEREANILSIISFGQVPQQVMSKPHPSPKSSKKYRTFTTRPDKITVQKMRSDSFSYPVYLTCSDGQTVSTSKVQTSTSLMSCHMIVIDEASLFVVKKPSNEFVRFLDDMDFSTVSSVAASTDGSWLSLTRQDGAVILCRIYYQKGEIRDIRVMNTYNARANLLCSSVSADNFVVFAGGKNAIHPFDIGLFTSLPPIKTDFIVSKLEFDEYASLLYAAGEKTVAVCSVSGDIIMKCKTESPVTALDYSKIPATALGRFIATGHANGSVMFWRVDFAENKLCLHSTSNVAPEPILSINVTQEGQRILVGTPSAVFTLDAVFASSYTPLKKDLFPECAVCRADIGKGSHLCSRCGRYLCAKCVKKETSTLKTTVTCHECLEASTKLGRLFEPLDFTRIFQVPHDDGQPHTPQRSHLDGSLPRRASVV